VRHAARPGFTLVEMLVVLVILGVVAGVSVPAIRDLRAADPLEKAASDASTLLARARQTAVERGLPVRVTLDPATRRYWVRALARSAPMDSVTTDTLPLPPNVEIDVPAPRLAITFTPTGEAHGDTITFRWQGRIASVSADQWTGDAHVSP
jgi:type IV fimbrial biogenesis protein FimT